MRFYDRQHRFYTGIDLHARSMHLCVLDAQGNAVFDRNLPWCWSFWAGGRARRGQQVRGPCPVHHSRSPRSRSFSAQLGRGIWQCFVCGASGNALDLWARVTGQELYAAVLALYRQLGRAVPWLEAGPWPKEDKRAIRSRRE